MSAKDTGSIIRTCGMFQGWIHSVRAGILPHVVVPSCVDTPLDPKFRKATSHWSRTTLVSGWLINSDSPRMEHHRSQKWLMGTSTGTPQLVKTRVSSRFSHQPREFVYRRYPNGQNCGLGVTAEGPQRWLREVIRNAG